MAIEEGHVMSEQVGEQIGRAVMQVLSEGRAFRLLAWCHAHPDDAEARGRFWRECHQEHVLTLREERESGESSYGDS